ncbi:hypothetical protein [Bdellovibrio bacteriovorus]|uniref:Outer membrane protein n=1 Tax=Bdellovibrio bacteriovorus str. Tiberius TaxID=1069642 RepID=K7YL69_BDEBC|nr:hypothetical protein [Bdellovibrio bacteriovorus]AFY00486.1 hypothetical protein Bdt_0780 [Bdellovibrio bacteriovorus str. Tiberius]
MLLSWILLGGLSSFAVTPEQVLKTAWSDTAYTSQEEMRPTDSRNPLRNVEGFVSAEKEDDKNEYEVGLKFQFRSWPEWKLGPNSEPRKKVLKEASLAWALHERYLNLISYEISQQKMAVLNSSMKLSEGYLKAQSLSLRAGRTSTKSFLGAQGDIYKLKRLESVIAQENKLAVKKLKSWVPQWGESPLEGFDLISVQEVLDSLGSQPAPEASLTARISETEFKDISRELEILRGREDQWVKGLDVSQTRKEDEVGYKVELTLQLPHLGSDDLSRQKQNELILKKALKQKEAEDSKDRLLSLKNQIQSLAGLYKMTSQGLKESQKVKAQDTLSVLEGRLLQEQTELDLLSQQQEILTLFVEYLLESERLAAEPAKNHLSKTQKVVAL